MKNLIMGPRPYKPIDVSNMKPMEKYKHRLDPYDNENNLHSETKVKNPDEECGYLTGTMNFNSNHPWVQTYSKRRFSPLNPISDAIVIQDIAHSLSMACRYNGHCNSFYSIAQHSVIVSYLCDEQDALAGLLHDGEEFAIPDCPTPLKQTPQFEFYRKAADVLQQAIAKRFNLSSVEPSSVKKADMVALATEAKCLLEPREDWVLPVEPAPFTIVPLPPAEAKILFLNRFFDLIKRPDIKAKYTSKLDKMNNQEIREALFGK